MLFPELEPQNTHTEFMEARIIHPVGVSSTEPRRGEAIYAHSLALTSESCAFAVGFKRMHLVKS